MNVSAVSLNSSRRGCDCPQPCKKSENFAFTGKYTDKLSEDQEKELIAKARTKAAGYAVFGGFISSLYYGLRSDAKVARKFNLDPIADKDLVKRIKKEQLKWTLPAAIIDVALIVKGKGRKIIPNIGGSLLSAIPYFYSKSESGKKVEL